MPENIPYEIAREAIKEATKEWLDNAFSSFGRWTLRGIAAAIFAGAIGWVAHFVTLK